MTELMIDLAEEPARLSVRGALLVIERPVESRSAQASQSVDPGCLPRPEEVTVPLAEIAVVVASHPRISMSLAVLAGLARAGAAFVACDEKRMPAAMLLPLESHFVQGERFERQAVAGRPRKKRLWQQVVRAKIRAQGRVLVRLRGDDNGLAALAGKVRSGDVGGLEAQASRRYWPALFGQDFRRDPGAEDQNRLLNYGYAVLRAIAARAVCAAGLHPSLGLQHHNRYDAFREYVLKSVRL